MALVPRFLDLTEGAPSPLIFRRWSAIGLISALLGRRTWVSINPAMPPVYPTLYVILVAEPTVGKTAALDAARSMLPPFWDNITAESLTAEMAKLTPPQHAPIYIDEASSLFGEEQQRCQTLMAFLTSMYNCPATYNKATKTGGVDKLIEPSITAVMGTQPRWIKRRLTTDSLQEGWGSRQIFVYSNEELPFLPEKPRKPDTTARDYLKAECDRVAGCTPGERRMMRDAWAYYYERCSAAEPPPHLALEGMRPYWRRRGLHWAKLALCAAVDAGNGNITVGDLEVAEGWLAEAETNLWRIYELVGGNQYREMEELAIRLVTPKGISETELHRHLRPHVGLPLRQLIVDALEGPEVKVVGEKPYRTFLKEKGK